MYVRTEKLIDQSDPIDPFDTMDPYLSLTDSLAHSTGPKPNKEGRPGILQKTAIATNVQFVLTEQWQCSREKQRWDYHWASS